MDERYICYCGLYCKNCAVVARINPAAKLLHCEMVYAGFDQYIEFIPGGAEFWPFLKHMAETGMCISCKEGGGDPGCAIRICAKGKGVELCPLCESYPCEHFDEFLKKHRFLVRDNNLLREDGFEAWASVQDELNARGYVIQDEKK